MNPKQLKLIDASAQTRAVQELYQSDSFDQSPVSILMADKTPHRAPVFGPISPGSERD
jgi:hypothetical protein